MAFVAQTIIDGHRNVIIKVTGTDTDSGIAVDVSTLEPSCTRVNINRVWFSSASGQTGAILWDATADDLALDLVGLDGDFDFTKFGGLTNPNSAGVTGDVLITGAGTGKFTVVLWCTKRGTIDPQL